MFSKPAHGLFSGGAQQNVGLFSGGNQSSGGLFSKPVQPMQPSQGLFSGNQPSGGLFGGTQPSQGLFSGNAQPSGGLFGAAGAKQINPVGTAGRDHS